MIDHNKIKEIILKAGKEAMIYYHANNEIEIKADDSPVTLADKASNKILVDSLAVFGYPILSEESADDLKRLDSEYAFIVDPLDGTADFIQKTGEFSILVSLVKDHQPVMSLVYLPVPDKLYWAKAGEGSWLENNGGSPERLQVTDNKIDLARVLVSRNHFNPDDQKACQELDLKMVQCGSNGIKMCLVAEGQAELFFNSSVNKMSEWDAAAPQLILTEAGGKVTDISGRMLLFNQLNIKLGNGILGSNGACHQTIIDYYLSHGKVSA